MKNKKSINTLFLDIGGVLLTNGWDRHARHRAVEAFNLDDTALNERHHLTFDTYEAGKLSLDEYLKRVVFYKERNFSPKEFKEFMFRQTKPFPEMIRFIFKLKSIFNLKTVAVSNEGRELTRFRIQNFNLNSVFDAFICSSFVHLRKPDTEIYQIALDIAQVTPEQVVYLDDRAMFVEVARGLGIYGIHHQNLETTRSELAKLNLKL